LFTNLRVFETVQRVKMEPAGDYPIHIVVKNLRVI
jgi:hypothetical protein